MRTTSWRPGAALAAALFAAPLHGQNTETQQRAVIPPPMHWEALAFDRARGQIVLFGGFARVGNAFGYAAKTLEWNGRAWRTAIDSADSPPPRHAHAMAYDAAAERVVLFGGAFESASGAANRCDTWTYDGMRWTLADDSACITDRPAAASLAYDARARALLLVDGSPSPPADTVARPLRIWRWSGAAWSLVDSVGPRRPSPMQVAYDERRSVLVVPVFTGPDRGVWEWDGRAWHRESAEGPRARDRYAAVYDARLQRVVVIGGVAIDTDADETLADAWTWDGERWQPLPSLGTTPPGPRSHATLLADAANARLLYFGGSNGGPLLQELWLYDARGWRRWEP